MPTTDHTTEVKNYTLEFPDEDVEFHGRSNENHKINVPDADVYENYSTDDDDNDGDTGDDKKGWMWKLRHAQRHDLRNYVAYLGEVFYPRLEALRDAAANMATAVESFSGSYGGFETEFQRLAAGVVNDSALALALILDGIAAQLALPVTSKREGSKRLALQVLFRQHWYPDGYVMGKLVGYKNLLPNQRDTFKRRTFVKTSRETSTVQEFATERQNDQTHNQRESAEITREMARQFNFTANASGHYDTQIWGVSGGATFGTNLSQASKALQTMTSEAISKSSVKYNEKREVKLRELTEVEDVQEVSTEVANLNREITANYFYYQLLRQYKVTSELYDLRPVLLRARELPRAAEVDDKFISKYGYILFSQLPPQLATDAQESADRLDGLTKRYIRTRTEMFQRTAEFEVFRNQAVPGSADEAAYARYREEFQSRERLLGEARVAFIAAEEEKARLSARMDRVVAHVRDNICYYMQFIWQASPKVDEDMLLAEADEDFCGQRLPAVTRGLIRQGYFGNEEIFEYTGESLALFDLLISNLTPGSEIASMGIDALRNTSLFQYLQRYFDDDEDALLAYIQQNAFVTDRADPDGVLSSRTVQIAQDALVVETMPGQVPLLEGFQMAHRMLDVQRACLENDHLAQRIQDRPWQNAGADSYAVRRYDGVVPPTRETTES